MPDTPDFSPEAIAEREAKATPGPWESCGMDDADWIKPDCEYAMTVWAPSPDPPHIIRHAITCDTFQEADADFIAHARQDIPALLAALEAERVARANMQQRLTAAQDLLDAVSDEMVSFTAEWHAPEIVAAFAALDALIDPDGRIDR